MAKAFLAIPRTTRSTENRHVEISISKRNILHKAVLVRAGWWGVGWILPFQLRTSKVEGGVSIYVLIVATVFARQIPLDQEGS